MKKRIFAIVNENEFAKDDVLQIADKLSAVDGKVVIFSIKPEMFNGIACEVVKIPATCDNRPKMKNFVVRHFKNINFRGYLHEIEDKIVIEQNPRTFVSDIENMMNVLDLNNWCGTVTDGCNYIYSRYNPRLSISIDKPEYQKLNIDKVIFCSHSNVQWLVYDLEKADDNELFFNESFTVDMFWIIEYLARRRNTHPNSLYFMNQYFTCASEKGIYKIIKCQKQADETRDMQKVMKDEDAIFKSLNVNYAPDNNIDNVLEILYKKLESKIS